MLYPLSYAPVTAAHKWGSGPSPTRSTAQSDRLSPPASPRCPLARGGRRARISSRRRPPDTQRSEEPAAGNRLLIAPPHAALPTAWRATSRGSVTTSPDGCHGGSRGLPGVPDVSPSLPLAASAVA